MDEFVLGAVDGRPLPSYIPGSHLAVRAGDVVNAYSLLDDGHRPPVYRLGIRHGAVGGGSDWLHRYAQRGTRLRASPPRSAFAPVLSAARHLLVAAGIGITPILSHLHAARRWGRPVELIVGAGTPVFADELDQLAPPHTTVVTGRQALRHAVRHALARQPLGTHAYACGPPGFLDEFRSLADEFAWPGPRIHIEHFTAPALDAGRPFDAVLGESGRSVTVPSGISLLQALDGLGIRLDRMCERGVCGRCEIGVLAGQVEHRDLVLSDADHHRGGLMLACVSRGIGTITIDTPEVT